MSLYTKNKPRILNLKESGEYLDWKDEQDRLSLEDKGLVEIESDWCHSRKLTNFLEDDQESGEEEE